MKLIEPVVDFGLQKINTTSKFRINIENTSPIPSEVLLKSFRYDNLNFANYQRNLDHVKSVQTVEGNLLKIDKPTAVIPAHSRCEFLITLDSIRQETLEEYFEVMVRDGDSSLFF